MDTLDYIVKKYNVDLNQRNPVEIPNVGREPHLAELFAELGFKKGAEIGVEAGLYSRVLCKTIPDLELYSIDPWKAYKGYREYVTQEKIDTFYEKAKERLSPYNATLIKKTSVEASKDFEDGSLDFVFIDGNHTFPHVVQDLDCWVRKVRKGGIVSGHDYVKRNPPTFTHVVSALNGYVDAYHIKPFFVLGRKEKRDGEVRDKSRSWMFVKE